MEQYFNNLRGVAGQNSLEQRELWTDNTIRNYAFGSTFLGLIPFPLIDLVALAVIQLKLIAKLSDYYGVNFSEGKTKNIIAALTGSAVPLGLTRAMCSFFKVFPIFGHAVSIVSMSALSAGSTYALGKLFVNHFESGGTFLNFDMEKAKHFYDEQVKKGKELAESLKARLNKTNE
ncbi:MAG TPA: DUF697 domain-containing protein [Nitrospirae bacterium]|nr:DUF697 domain-containing protein [Nitrospirota bacterium]